MAGEKTEAPTPKRLQDARKRGQVARSREVDTAVVILAAFAIFRFAGAQIWGGVESLAVDTWGHLGESPLTSDLAAEMGLALVWRTLLLLAPLLMAITAVALISGVAQSGGPLFTPEPLKPKLNRLDPIKGFKRLVGSRQAYMNLAKALFKFGILGVIVALTFRGHWDALNRLGLEGSLASSMSTLASVAFDLVVRVAAALLVLAGADYLFQRFDMSRELRMTRQEVEDEFKQTDGNPQVKSQLARARRSLLSRVMQAVPKADVVIVNPTHYAVALKYDPTSSNAPVVVAKGMHLIAQRIREVAEEHGIPVIQNPPLCRAIYKAARIGQEIPPDLYEAVAAILAFVYRLRTGRGVGLATA
jgi:flagellar biosynthetic protein FlhB